MASRAALYALTLFVCCAHAEGQRALEPLSGYAYQDRETQALQDDDFANPGMLWIDRGAVAWHAGETSCASCHGSPQALKGVAPRYPRYEAAAGTVINLEQQINRCRTKRQRAPALPYESETLLALTTLVAFESRGLPFAVAIDGPARPYFEAGREYFYTRRGQMNLACHHCHERNPGRILRGDRLSQGQSNAYPIYRLGWQGVGSLHRRLRFCNAGVRAETAPLGDQTYVNLELFLAWRAGALPLESPGVRR